MEPITPELTRFAIWAIETLGDLDYVIVVDNIFWFLRK